MIFIGRFQPFHLGHFYILNRALSLADEVLLLMGSTLNQEKSFDPQNPWSFKERQEMLKAVISNDMGNLCHYALQRIKLHQIFDCQSDKEWLDSIMDLISLLGWERPRCGLIGHFKDQSSYYLSMLQFKVLLTKNYLGIDATKIRERLVGLPAAEKKYLSLAMIKREAADLSLPVGTFKVIRGIV